jgi:hypothetical protein
MKTPANEHHVPRVTYQKKSCESASCQMLSSTLKIVVSSVSFRVAPSHLFPAQDHFHLVPDPRFEAPARGGVFWARTGGFLLSTDHGLEACGVRPDEDLLISTRQRGCVSYLSGPALAVRPPTLLHPLFDDPDYPLHAQASRGLPGSLNNLGGPNRRNLPDDEASAGATWEEVQKPQYPCGFTSRTGSEPDGVHCRWRWPRRSRQYASRAEFPHAGNPCSQGYVRLSGMPDKRHGQGKSHVSSHP